MSWRCSLVDGHRSDPKVGEMWWVKIASGERRIMVALPGDAIWCDSSEPPTWTTTGDPPLITVSPSINVHGGWHGFISGGVISDDVSGKVFEE